MTYLPTKVQRSIYLFENNRPKRETYQEVNYEYDITIMIKLCSGFSVEVAIVQNYEH